MKSISVIGLGYIGLPTAALLAKAGYQVAGFDTNQSVVETVNQGRIHIVEPELDSAVSVAVATGRLRAYSTCQVADIYMICVPTPFHEGAEVPVPNIDYVLSAAKAIAPMVKRGSLIILESTSPVGTTEKIAEVLTSQGISLEEVSIAYCPERVLPGKIMKELLDNDRVVGGINADSTRVAAAFYRSFVQGAVLETNARTAEMCKLTENSFRDVNIAFANELSLICAKENIDVWELISLANRHPRVKILQPGTGVGGHCIAVDPWFIVARNPKQAKLIKTAREVNSGKTLWVIDQIKIAAADAAMRLNRKPQIACLGLAFKPDIDDLRESPACQVAEALINANYDIQCVEPHISQHGAFQLAPLSKALDSADVIAVLVRHSQFTLETNKAKLRNKVVLDFVGL